MYSSRRCAGARTVNWWRDPRKIGGSPAPAAPGTAPSRDIGEPRPDTRRLLVASAFRTGLRSSLGLLAVRLQDAGVTDARWWLAKSVTGAGDHPKEPSMSFEPTRRSLGKAVGFGAIAAPARTSASTLARFSPRRAGVADVDHSQFDRLLERHVRGAPDGINRVDYARWRASRADMTALHGYLRRLQATDPQGLTRAAQLAFWINLYNAETLRVVLDAYPVRSILAIHPILLAIGPWKHRTLRVAGVYLSLDEVENGVLRPHYADPRVRYALNCASLGCPNLKPTAWRATDLEPSLDAAARAFVNHPRGVRLEPQGARLSAIYKWHREDFGSAPDGAIRHIRAYADEPLRMKLALGARIAGYAYDWGLNDAAAGRA